MNYKNLKNTFYSNQVIPHWGQKPQNLFSVKIPLISNTIDSSRNTKLLVHGGRQY